MPLRRTLPSRAALHFAALAAFAITLPLAAQELDPGDGAAHEVAERQRERAVDWDVQSEVSGSFFFGNTEQTLFSTRGAVGRSDSTIALKSDVRFTYGETTDEEGQDAVTKRAWLATLNLDLQPYAWTSPFLIGTLETSLEKRIDLRYSAGFGNKFVVLRNDRSHVDLSVALLGEWSTFAGTPPSGVDESLVRWSARVKLQHELGERLTLRSETSYRPEVASAARYTMTSNSNVGYRMRRWATLQLGFLGNYDSEARSRGARTNNDGQMIVGVVGAW